MGIISGVFKVAGSAVLGVTGTAAAILGMVVESTGNDADLFTSIQNGSFNTIGKMWGKEVDETPKSEEETLQHQIEVREKGKRTAKRMAEMALKACDREKYIEMMERYYTLEDEAISLKYNGEYNSNLEDQLDKLHAMTDAEFERKCRSVN